MSNVSEPNEHFRGFAKTLEQHIAREGKPADWFKFQKYQVESLIKLEHRFRKTLIAHRYGPWAYGRFITFITEERRNILAARPYFRERQEMFASQISKALKEGNRNDLSKFAINYQFILFVMRQRKWGVGTKIVRLAEEVRKLRQTILVMNMPLGISRARIFFSRTPRSHLSYMDEISIAAEGMM